MNYLDFLKTKIEVAPVSGFSVSPEDLSPALKPHQRDAVIWALNGGPLQFDIVDRLITRYSNEGDLIFDPFGGVGTTPLRALKLNRRGLMTELNEGYFRDAVGYLHEEEAKADVPTLFDLIDEAG